MERPNTTAGLAAKRDELHKQLLETRAHEKKLICAIDHVEGAMRLFAADGMPSRIVKNVSVHRAQKGSVTRLVRQMLREADGPITAADITAVQIKQRNLNADDVTFVMLRKRVGACLTKLRTEGFIRKVPLPGLYVGWELAK
jgi:hypothetical protein